MLFVFVFAFGFFTWPNEAKAEVAQARDLGIGMNLAFGFGTEEQSLLDGGFTLGLEPVVAYFPIDKLAIFGKLGWRRIFDDSNRNGKDNFVDMFAMIGGVRYYFQLHDRLYLYPGVGVGYNTIWVETGGTMQKTDIKFGVNGHVMLEYEVADFFTIGGGFDFFSPNIAPNNKGEKIILNYSFMLGATYFLPL